MEKNRWFERWFGRWFGNWLITSFIGSFLPILFFCLIVGWKCWTHPGVYSFVPLFREAVGSGELIMCSMAMLLPALSLGWSETIKRSNWLYGFTWFVFGVECTLYLLHKTDSLFPTTGFVLPAGIITVSLVMVSFSVVLSFVHFLRFNNDTSEKTTDEKIPKEIGDL